jgi:hypothetical protein
LDVFTGMAFSNLVMLAIIVATAQTIHGHRNTDVQSRLMPPKPSDR